MARRRPNAELRTREYLTEAEVEKLIANVQGTTLELDLVPAQNLAVQSSVWFSAHAGTASTGTSWYGTLPTHPTQRRWPIRPL